MTSEVAVLNSIGVALAADSAVTVGANAEKIYTTAEKLLRLSLYEPVGIMIYGNASFIQLPWETVIKVYRKELGSNKFNTIEEYGKDFLTWLTKNSGIVPRKSQDHLIRVLIRLYLLFLREEVIQKNLDVIIADKEGGITEEEIPNYLDDIIKEELKRIKEFPYLIDFSKEDVANVKENYLKDFRQAINDLFGKLEFKISTKKALYNLLSEILIRYYFTQSLKSGIVIAGFGDKEYKPTIITYEIEGVLNSKLRISQLNNDSISEDQSAIVIPFAQKDMVQSFMEGIDSRLFKFMAESIGELLIELKCGMIKWVSDCDENYGEIINSDFKEDEVLVKLLETWTEYRSRYWMPILDIVESLPKSELAELAESLVNLTKLRRKVTSVPETVGGPVDVAIITKGDGFIWIKRKHYFQANMNPWFFDNRSKEDVYEQQ